VDAGFEGAVNGKGSPKEGSTAPPGPGAGGFRADGGILATAGLDPDGLLVVAVEQFQGPLDLLLHLIRQQDIDVFDIPIATITDQFLAAIQGIQAKDLDSAGEFLEMAATLIRIKAQMLLPRPGFEEDEDPRAELVRRLLEYEQIREIASRLSRSEAEWARRFRKGFVESRSLELIEDTSLETTWEEVMEVAMAVQLPHPLAQTHRVATGLVAMEEKIQLILDTLKDTARVEFSQLVAPWKGRIHGVMTFLAGLELSRQRALSLRQARLFSELWFLRRDLEAWVRHEAQEAQDIQPETEEGA
jgi:segregation and condensation protein A